MRSVLVPALSYDLGRAIWWPSPLSRAAQDGSYPVEDVTPPAGGANDPDRAMATRGTW